MKRALLLLIGLLLSVSAWADKQSFLVKQGSEIIQQEGDCQSRHAPCSTFKIAISLMGYDAGILVSETTPEFPFKEGYPQYIPTWKQSHSPSLWMKNSCLWFSHVVTQELGMEKFTDYVVKFNYGNQDVSGDKGTNNGLTRSWLSSSLEISPEEQTLFLQKLLDNKLPVSLQAHEMTRNILFLEELADGWKLYGKTGSGSLLSQDRTQKLDVQLGWFIGWLQKGKQTIVFAQYLEDEVPQASYAGPRAKVLAKEKLIRLIQKLKR